MTDASDPPGLALLDEAKPRIWVLADGRTGHRSQGVGIAEALGWPYEVKDLRFTGADGDRIQMFVIFPPDADESTPLPLDWRKQISSISKQPAVVPWWPVPKARPASISTATAAFGATCLSWEP